MEQGEIILYQPDEAVKLEVRLEDETVWLTQAQLVELFQSSKANISEHIKNIYEQGWKIQCKLPPKTKRFCPLVLK